MKIELDRNDISNLLVALNAVDVKGKSNMVTVLNLIAKLENAMRAETARPPETPRQPEAAKEEAEKLPELPTVEEA